MLVEWGGDGWNSDNFMTGRNNGVATYRNSTSSVWLTV
jgi:predicted porin